jgi:hypothetical protein
METLSFVEKTQLNEAILSALRMRLLDKDQPVIDPAGKMYMQRDPTNESLLGSIGSQPDENFDGYQAPNSMGVVLLVKPEGPEGSEEIHLQLSGQLDVSHRYIPETGEMRANHLKVENNIPTLSQTIPFCYQRHTIQFNEVDIRIPLATAENEWVFPATGHSLETAIEDLEDRLKQDPRVYRECKLNDSGLGARFNVDWVDSEVVTQEDLNNLVRRDIFEDVSKVLPYEVVLRARARRAPASISNITGGYLVEIFMENRTSFDIAKSYAQTKPYLLDSQFTAELIAGKSHLLPHKLSPEEYRYQPGNGVPGYGINTSVEKGEGDRFSTNAMPTHKQDRLENPTLEELGMSHKPAFEDLSNDPLPILQDLLAALDREVVKWDNKIQGLREEGKEADADEAERDKAAFVNERDNVHDGIDLLSSEEKLMRCFKWMNTCMKNAVVRQGKSFDQWRLFQLGFILTQTRAVYERCCSDASLSDDHLDHAEVLWFATGGGKTEAYLGLLVMGMLYERMHDKWYGATGWMRFPLRMLSVQQFHRLAYVVAQANQIRQAEGLGGHPYTIGYFTGGGTPNNITRKENEYFLPNLSPDKLRDLKFVRDCPYCDQKDTIEVQKDVDAVRIRHVCTNTDCWSNTTAEAGSYGEGIRGEIGIYVSDDEVYRYLPTIMVGTVDKLANIGVNYRFRSFFGGASHFCPEHGFSIGGKCIHYSFLQRDDGQWETEPCKGSTQPRAGAPKTIQVSAIPLPGISFMIQDELHLMKEAMGNFNAHYESLLEGIQGAYGGRKPKVLAATATIKDYGHHVNHLYQRKARRFPAPGINLGESFYTKVMRDSNGDAMTRRLYAGIMPVGQGPVISRSTAKVSRRYIALIDDLMAGLGDPSTAKDTAISLGFTEADVDRLLDHIGVNMSADMTYVNSNAGMSDVAGFLGDANEDLSKVYSYQMLSGQSTLDEIQGAIIHMETRGPADEPRQILANSVVSHGVDIERLNFMVISRWTKSISEYMQVSARAGRIHPGIVLVVFQGSSVFENSVFSDFKDYHRFMDRLVESVPINRFSPNLLHRTLPGIVSAWLHVWATSQTWGADAYKQGDKLRRALKDPSHHAMNDLKSMVTQTLAVPGYDMPAFDQRVSDSFKDDMNKMADDMLQILANIPGHQATMRLSEILEESWGCGPMRSLRDIESQLPVLPQLQDYRELFEMLGR